MDKQGGSSQEEDSFAINEQELSGIKHPETSVQAKQSIDRSSSAPVQKPTYMMQKQSEAQQKKRLQGKKTLSELIIPDMPNVSND